MSRNAYLVCIVGPAGAESYLARGKFHRGSEVSHERAHRYASLRSAERAALRIGNAYSGRVAVCPLVDVINERDPEWKWGAS